MRSRAYRKRLLLFLISAVIFSFIQSVSSFAADTVKYYYDDLNRLIRIEDTVSNKVVEYVYDEVGNRTSKVSYLPLTITASAGANGSISPSGDAEGKVYVAYNTDKTFTITPNAGYEISTVLVDAGSVGYENTYTFTSVVASHSISASFQTLVAPCRIGSTEYATLQAAYDAALDGAIIRAKAKTYTENLTVNRNISVSIEGGYNPSFTSITGMTNLKGWIQTTATGGTLTIKNFILNN
jgi:YD repeat-containing protein